MRNLSFYIFNIFLHFKQSATNRNRTHHHHYTSTLLLLRPYFTTAAPLPICHCTSTLLAQHLYLFTAAGFSLRRTEFVRTPYGVGSDADRRSENAGAGENYQPSISNVEATQRKSRTDSTPSYLIK